MVVVFVLVAIAVIALLAGVHRYVWSRLVRDTTAGRGRARRIGTVVMWVLPLLSLGALMSGRAGAPLWLESVLAWPGYLWLAVLLYLVLALLVGEVVRAVWLRLGTSSPAEPAVAAPEPSLHTVPAGAAETPAPASGTAAPNGPPAETPAPESRGPPRMSPPGPRNGRCPGDCSSRVSWAVEPPRPLWGPSVTGRTEYCADRGSPG